MAGVARALRPDQEVTVALVGPHALVERIVLAGLPGAPGRAMHEMPGAPADEIRRRLLMAAYRSEQEAPDKVARLGGAADACLFASRAPYEYARRAGVLSCPATYIQLGDGPLLAALREAAAAGHDLRVASFDTLGRPEVERALSLLGLPADGCHLHDDSASAAAVASFHARLWRIGQTSAAVTCMDEVARRLASAQVPAFIIQPTDAAISAALQISTLLARNRTLADSRLAVALVEVPQLRDTSGKRAPRPAREELRLTVHRFLVQEARRIHAAVTPVSDHSFMIFATSGSLASGSVGDPAFVTRARAVLGIALDVGIGTGRTQREAEDRARFMLGQPAADGRVAAVSAPSAGSISPRDIAQAPVAAGLGNPGKQSQRPASVSRGARPATGQAASLARQLHAERPLAAGQTDAGRTDAGRTDAGRTDAGQPPAGQMPAGQRQPVDSLSRLRGLETLAKLAQRLADDATPVVDAELTGQLLSVTPRTARRQLRALVDEGLALPLPPSRSQHPGRPRQAYRLVVEKLERRAAL
jgi:hypothetical protein